MSCAIEQGTHSSVVRLDSEMTIRNAAEFYQAVLPLAGFDGAVRIDASASKSIHTSIMQILHALSLAAHDFAVVDASAEFRAAEIRVGLTLIKTELPQTSNPTAGSA